jgi:hypothetical protein
VELFEGLLPCSILGCKSSWQWWCSHLICLCVVVTDCKKIKKSFVHVDTKFCGNQSAGSKVEMDGGGGESHRERVMLEAYIFLLGGKVTKNIKCNKYMTLFSVSTLLLRVQSGTLIFLLYNLVRDSVLCHSMFFRHACVSVYMHRKLHQTSQFFHDFSFKVINGFYNIFLLLDQPCYLLLECTF